MKEILDKLDKMKRNAKLASRPMNIPLKEIFTDDFLQKHTKFGSFAELEEKATAEDLQNQEWVLANTNFQNLDEMIRVATKESGVAEREMKRIQRQVFKGI